MDKMDSETLRWILAVMGAFVIASVYIWGRYKERLLNFIFQRGEYDELRSDRQRRVKAKSRPKDLASAAIPAGGAEPGKLEPSISFERFDGDDDLGQETQIQPPEKQDESSSSEPRAAALGAPFLIQVSVVVNGDGYFAGTELRDALDELRLIYGDMGIYHRYDREYRVPLFSVASLVEPGTFPIKDMENFCCPGVVVFYQPPQVDDPIAVFDDLIDTCHQLAMRLDGVVWDEKRQPLTGQKVAQMRARLLEAY